VAKSSNQKLFFTSAVERAIGLLIVLLIVNIKTVSAQNLEYADVDLATVRILSVKGVRTQEVPVLGSGEHTVAIPVLSHGTGIVVSPDGIILTANHVIDGALSLAVKMPGDQEAYPAKVLYRDPDWDFAFITTNRKTAKFLKISSDPRKLVMREHVNAIGYPIDATSKYPLSSPGIIAGELPDGLIQLGISLNPGNSGGPIIDASDQLIGIVVARGDPAQGVLGLGLAVPIREIFKSVPQVTALNQAAQTSKWSEEDEVLAAMTGALVENGPAGLLRDVSRLLRERNGSTLAELRLKALAAKNVSFSVIAAAYLWDAIVMLGERREDYREGKNDNREAKTQDYLGQVIELCHRAIIKDPNVTLRSTFVSFVVDQWPDPKTKPTLAKSVRRTISAAVEAKQEPFDSINSR
jgi:S1-C subfamily serine protease